MAWSWSHTQEAYTNAYNNLFRRFRPWLEVVFAEWEVKSQFSEEEEWDSDLYYKSLEKAKTLPEDTLVEYIWEHMEEQAICENGGHRAWGCPYGCNVHMVSFDEEKDDEVL